MVDGLDRFKAKTELKKIMLALSVQLEELERKGRDIEDAVGDAVLNGSMEGIHFCASLQGLDHLVQVLGELSSFLRSISTEIDARQEVSVSVAARRIRLRELSYALGLIANRFERPPESFGAGDVDIF